MRQALIRMECSKVWSVVRFSYFVYLQCDTDCSTLTYAAETWCLKVKMVKLNSTEMDFWQRSARISRNDRIMSTAIKQRGTQWLRHCATNWKVAGSISDSVFGIFR
jgi:hypothetical protein